jgi:hypothetical protein
MTKRKSQFAEWDWDKPRNEWSDDQVKVFQDAKALSASEHFIILAKQYAILPEEERTKANNFVRGVVNIFRSKPEPEPKSSPPAPPPKKRRPGWDDED